MSIAIGMKTKLTKLSLGVFFTFGLMSCASFDVVDSDLQNILARNSGKKFVRASLNRTKVEPLKAPPVKAVDQNDQLSFAKYKEKEEVKKYLTLYSSKKRQDVEVPLEKRAEHLPIIETVLEYYDLPQELSNLAFVESKFDTSATSPRGAKGIWQLMKPTAESLGLNCRFWNDERKDVLRSSIAAARYIRELKDKFGDWLLVIAAYNAGPARIEAAMARSKGSSDFFTLARKGLLPKETVSHVSKFVALTLITEMPDTFGFQLANINKTLGDEPLTE